MALLQNGSILNQYPLRHLGAGVHADISAANRNDRRNIYSGITDLKSGIPNGHGSPSAWLLPLKPGGMSSINYARVTITGVASGVMGVTSPADASFSIQGDGTGGLITSGFGSASMTVQTNIATILATLSGEGSASASMSMAGTIDAIGYFMGDIGFTVSASMIPYATGTMSGSTIDATAITNDSIAAAVWSAIAASYNTAGTMGNKLNTASSGGVDLQAIADAIIASLEATTIPVDVQKMNGADVIGTGQTGDSWRGQGVPP